MVKMGQKENEPAGARSTENESTSARSAPGLGADRFWRGRGRREFGFSGKPILDGVTVLTAALEIKLVGSNLDSVSQWN